MHIPGSTVHFDATAFSAAASANPWRCLEPSGGATLEQKSRFSEHIVVAVRDSDDDDSAIGIDAFEALRYSLTTDYGTPSYLSLPATRPNACLQLDIQPHMSKV